MKPSPKHSDFANYKVCASAQGMYKILALDLAPMPAVFDLPTKSLGAHRGDREQVLEDRYVTMDLLNKLIIDDLSERVERPSDGQHGWVGPALVMPV